MKKQDCSLKDSVEKSLNFILLLSGRFKEQLHPVNKTKKKKNSFTFNAFLLNTIGLDVIAVAVINNEI